MEARGWGSGGWGGGGDLTLQLSLTVCVKADVIRSVLAGDSVTAALGKLRNYQLNMELYIRSPVVK